jgi:Double-GTPase 2
MGEASSSIPRVYKMHSGNAMTVQQIALVCRRRFTPIIFMAGEISSGKTTLIASLHDAFLFGALAGFRFAGSRTLLAFEERAFESRAKSNGLVPQTPRTRYENGQEYFHLRIQKEQDPSLRNYDILFADMSGEFYERSIQQRVEAQQLRSLTRAQTLLVLLDGEKLSNPQQRQKVRSDALSFLRRCMEERVLTDDTEVQVLISKWDSIAKLPEDTQKRVLHFVEGRINAKAIGRQVIVKPIASRPGLGSSAPKLFGVKELFSGWIHSRPQPLQSNAAAYPPIQALSAFSRFPGMRGSL